MSLPSALDVKIKEEEPVEVDSSPPDSPVSNPRSPPTKEKVGPPDRGLSRLSHEDKLFFHLGAKARFGLASFPSF